MGDVNQHAWELLAQLTDQADELGIDWRQMPVDEQHLRVAIHVLAAAIGCKRTGRPHWLLGL